MEIKSRNIKTNDTFEYWCGMEHELIILINFLFISFQLIFVTFVTFITFLWVGIKFVQIIYNKNNELITRNLRKYLLPSQCKASHKLKRVSPFNK